MDRAVNDRKSLFIDETPFAMSRMNDTLRHNQIWNKNNFQGSHWQRDSVAAVCETLAR